MSLLYPLTLRLALPFNKQVFPPVAAVLPPSRSVVSFVSTRHSSSKRWLARQHRDQFAREARVQGLKSRAAFKLLQIDEKYRLFRGGNTVVDLGFAPGSWAQVAIDRTKPNGRVLGIDLLPVQPPRGVSTIQGNFLDPEVRADVKNYLRDYEHGRARPRQRIAESNEDGSVTMQELEEAEHGYLERERRESSGAQDESITSEEEGGGRDRMVDVVLSDMWEPWDQTTGFWKKSLSNPYLRMMNTSGVAFRDHASSMDLCQAALEFCFDTLKTGGHFVCKFYQGAEDKALEMRLKHLFRKVHREKPESSRSESKEAYFVGLKREANAKRELVFDGS
ncbi:MAG: hypothetical protein Q9227_006639 [Pyrenula ochraceoflavens]